MTKPFFCSEFFFSVAVEYVWMNMFFDLDVHFFSIQKIRTKKSVLIFLQGASNLLFRYRNLHHMSL